MAEQSNHAIVFGASGLLGWSVVNQLLSEYPHTGTFSKVTAVFNRPVPEKDLYWPKASSGRPELQIVSGVNLLEGTGEDLASDLKGKMRDAVGITHAFYFVFTAINDDHIRECRVNCGMMERVADALNIITPNLKSLVYSGGIWHLQPRRHIHSPLEESMADNLPEDYAKTVAYPWFRHILNNASQNRGWTWTELCPDAVIGFSPNGSGFSLALHWAQYLSLYAYNHGIRASASSPVGSPRERIEVPFPGVDAAADSLSSPVSERTLGRASIHAALHQDACAGKVINIADSAQPTTLRELWSVAAHWFGLVGVGPSSDPGQLKPSEYVDKYKYLFQRKGLTKALTCGVGAGGAQLDRVGWWLTFDRHLSLERLRGTGFMDARAPVAGWIDAFERFRAAGVIF
ncbi:Short chain dehydrogenase sirQ-like protein [Cladobotryum mycophilum]|uniref:Short chain dehydrogenase sirQ-like protein n=1 Tax=Cladobotryum mycophilum TaxID=491253 RepID=A0ABR0SUS2_9HYPO